MNVTKTVEIPADHRLTIDVPAEVPAGRAVITFTPATDQRSDKVTEDGLDYEGECPICAAHNYTLRPEIMEEILEEERAVERGEITRKVYDDPDEFWKDLLSDDEDE
jgi:hypothetical protein